jgi:hypothetical protein
VYFESVSEKIQTMFEDKLHDPLSFLWPKNKMKNENKMKKEDIKNNIEKKNMN